MTIAGLDPSGGAGIVADIKTFARFNCFPACVITSVTFQNTVGVFGAVHQTADSVKRQAEAVFDDMGVAAVKTGMLPTGEIIEAVAEMIGQRQSRNIVVDPVVRSTSGFDLIDDAALRVLIEKLFPLSNLITPNLPEAERIAQMTINSEDSIAEAASMMRQMGARNVLIKGGHMLSKSNTAKDFLFIGDELTVLKADFIDTTATHGTGCTLASAISANLALGHELKEAVAIAKRFVNDAIRTAPHLGRGNSPINI
jgi:hydroxymethylpyrimidine kinase/phosphomethylpyrimidine kinase